MRIEDLKECVVIGFITLAGACGDANGPATASQGGSSSDSTGATGGATGTTSGATMGGESDSVTAGSNSDSQTMGTTPTSTDPTTDATSTGTTGPATATDTGSETTAQTDPGGTDGTTGTGGGSSGGTTGGNVGPCGDAKQWTQDADFDQGLLANVNHDPPNGDQLQITVDGISAPKPYMFVAQTNEGWVLKIITLKAANCGVYSGLQAVA